MYSKILSDRVLLLKLTGKISTIAIIILYTQMLQSKDEIDKFYNKLNNVKNQCKSLKMLMQK